MVSHEIRSNVILLYNYSHHKTKSSSISHDIIDTDESFLDHFAV
jgi:hypothetical protein